MDRREFAEVPAGAGLPAVRRKDWQPAYLRLEESGELAARARSLYAIYRSCRLCPRACGAECQQWMREAGFRKTWVEHLAGPESMVVGIK